ncbi:hypothetical protein ACHAWF_013254 [Thalassiosira exigua]
MRPSSFLTLAAASGWAAAASAADGGDAAAPLTFTALTGALPLYPGEVTNTWHRLDIPSGPLAISEFSADVVEKDPSTGEIIPVPLSSRRTCERARRAGASASGPGRSPAARTRSSHIRTASRPSRARNVHVINTRAMPTDDAHRCLECPCTSENRADGPGSPLLSSVLEKKSGWDKCNAPLVEEENTSCFPDKYYGGLFCCEHGTFCLDKYFLPEEERAARAGKGDQSVFYLRYTLTYEPATPEVKPLYLAACCDATGDNDHRSNIEYDIPKCDDDDDECIHVLETVQSLHGASGDADDEKEEYVDVVFMVGHQHRGGLSVAAYLADGSTLCESLPAYGTGAPGEIGNEPGYINSMSTCSFDPPLRMKTTDEIRVVGTYDASEAHTGVMSLFYIAIADATDEGPATGTLPPPAAVGQEALGIPRGDGALARLGASAALVAAVGAAVAAVDAAVRFYRRRNYEALPAELTELSV